MAFSPDGKRLAIMMGFEDYKAKIWDLYSDKAVLTLQGQMLIAFSPNGQQLVTVSDYKEPFSTNRKKLGTEAKYKTAKIWDLNTGKAAITLEGHQNSINSVVFSPDGKRLATGSADGTVKIWEFTPEGWTRVGGRGKRLAGLILPQLTEYGLENLLDQQPDNEARLVATGEVWQIAAFADLYADKLAKSLPKQEDYARAQRLYQACLASGVDNGYFEQKLAALEEVWNARGE